MEDCGLSDLGFQGKKFTWNNNREGHMFTKERLDRAFRNSSWATMFESTNVTTPPAQSTSDHSPLLVEMKNERPGIFNKEKLFRYEVSWEKREECKKLLKTTGKNRHILTRS